MPMRDRFLRIERDARDPLSDLEAVLCDETILFRHGLGCTVMTMIVVALFFVFWAFILRDFYPWPWSPSWICLGVLAAGVLYLFARRLTFRGRIEFEVNTTDHEILICWRSWEEERLAIQDIDYFLGYLGSGGDSGPYAVIYAVDHAGDLHQLTGGLGSFARMEHNVRVLAYTCDKLGVAVDWRTELPLDRSELLSKAQVLYVPGSVN
jgi:hypothetical protein